MTQSIKETVERLRSPVKVTQFTAAGELETFEAQPSFTDLQAASLIERLAGALERVVAWEYVVELQCPELGGLILAMSDGRRALSGEPTP